MDPLLIHKVDRYVSIGGSVIEDIGRHGTPADLDPLYLNNRIVRDESDQFHITLVNPIELSKKCLQHNIAPGKTESFIQTLIQQWTTAFGPPSTWEHPVDLGLGVLRKCPVYDAPKRPKLTKRQKRAIKAKREELESSTDHALDEQQIEQALQQYEDQLRRAGGMETAAEPVLRTPGCTTYYRVISWPFGQRLRASMDLPPVSFHITIGFDPKDIHLDKGPATLALLQQTEPLDDPVPLYRLATHATAYTSDILFLTRYFNACSINDVEHLTGKKRERKVKSKVGDDCVISFFL
ncbi:hypothetical protein DM01DRAFT_1177895 [Hesseltinella vesiculosa]|uniref:Swiss Army Knife 2H phosphoesterase domain-containing protein n=1 Tax=Hesseltinella vesiculosa TaxID=101127 RepID=A0A1X2G4R1_9FUNG|nr:hypothetical protein DM01DRAFT_1177895 [Hesseltinella vesiculosa]